MLEWASTWSASSLLESFSLSCSSLSPRHGICSPDCEFSLNAFLALVCVTMSPSQHHTVYHILWTNPFWSLLTLCFPVRSKPSYPVRVRPFRYESATTNDCLLPIGRTQSPAVVVKSYPDTTTSVLLNKRVSFRYVKLSWRTFLETHPQWTPRLDFWVFILYFVFFCWSPTLSSWCEFL